MPVSAKARTTCATDTGSVTRSREKAKERRRHPEEDGDPEHVLKRRLEGARRQRGVEAGLLDTIGMAVPAAPERLTEMNIETATTRPKDTVPCHTAPRIPTTTPHTAPMIDVVWIWRSRGSHQRASCTWPVARPRTTIVTDCSPVLPEMAWMTGMKEARRITRLSVAS